MPGHDSLKRLIGRDVDIDERNGRHLQGRLVNVTRRSLWVLHGDEDHFIAIADVHDLRAAG
jgi:hypothetical protein